MGRIKELREELKTVFTGRGSNLLDSIIPLLVFIVGRNLVSTQLALAGSAGIAFLIFLYRAFSRANFYYSLAGLGAVVIAAGFVFLSGSDAGFYLPGLISGGITVILCLVSVIGKRPLAAWSSYLTRRWPLAWYWHDRVRPAYAEVTLFWMAGFGARTVLEYYFYLQGNASSLGVVRTILGWPYTILLLVISYLYGVWRLGKLAGPSVVEFKEGKPAPWTGQIRGF